MSPEGEARGRHEFSGWDKSSCLPTNWAINFLLYRKLKHDVIQRRALCRETRQGNTTSGGKHNVLFSLHVTSLDQSYFFIRHINYMRYNNIVCSLHAFIQTSFILICFTVSEFKHLFFKKQNLVGHLLHNFSLFSLWIVVLDQYFDKTMMSQ